MESKNGKRCNATGAAWMMAKWARCNMSQGSILIKPVKTSTIYGALQN